MKRILARLNKREATKQDHPGPVAERLLRTGHTFLAENAFASVLHLERKRTDRSGASFLLMLLTVEEAATAGGREVLLLETALSLFTAVREVDMLGWYKHKVTIGVIFTEINDMCEQVIGRIVAKVHEALCARVGIGRANRVGISVHVFTNGEWRNESQER